MRSLFIALFALFLSALVPNAVRADVPRLWARLPAARGGEMLAALRLELAGRGELVVGAPLGDELTVSSAREQAREAGATHALWVVFPAGLLAPAEVRVLDLEESAPAHAMTPQAWDVVDSRVVAVLASSLLEGSDEDVMPMPDGAVIVGEPLPLLQATPSVASIEAPPAVILQPVPASEPASVAPDRVAPARTAETTTMLEEPQLGRARPVRRFSLALGMSLGHVASPGSPVSTTSSGQISFYGRVSDWASIGVRLRSGGWGYSSTEGAMFRGGIALPSFAVSFRESLGTAAAIEVGAHVEGGLFINYRESAPDPAYLAFGLGAGVFATLELGQVNGLQLDYTLDVFGFGNTGAWTWGSATLAYVHRFD